NPNRYDMVEEVDKFDNPTWMASASENIIRILKGDIPKGRIYNGLRKTAEELKQAGWTGERVSKVFEDPAKAKQFIIEHELSHVANQDYLKMHKHGDFKDPNTRK